MRTALRCHAIYSTKAGPGAPALPSMTEAFTKSNTMTPAGQEASP